MAINFLFILMGFYSYSQEPVNGVFELDGNILKVERKESVDTPQGFCEIHNKIILADKKEILFSAVSCTVEIEDIAFVKKGYLTVIEHYSSPVGWSQYYIFDFCKKRVIKTKELEEGTELVWNEFITLSNEVRTKYIKDIVEF